jgi:hypothetical protein
MEMRREGAREKRETRRERRGEKGRGNREKSILYKILLTMKT